MQFCEFVPQWWGLIGGLLAYCIFRDGDFWKIRSVMLGPGLDLVEAWDRSGG